jgi:hypothetical protein
LVEQVAEALCRHGRLDRRDIERLLPPLRARTIRDDGAILPDPQRKILGEIIKTAEGWQAWTCRGTVRSLLGVFATARKAEAAVGR